MFKIGLEARVQAGDDRNAKALGEGLRARPEDVGRGDMDQIGSEARDVLANLPRQPGGEPELASHRQCYRGHRDQVAGGLERRRVGHWRVDAELVALLQAAADQAIERLVGAFPDVIVIAGDERDPHRLIRADGNSGPR